MATDPSAVMEEVAAEQTSKREAPKEGTASRLNAEGKKKLPYGTGTSKSKARSRAREAEEGGGGAKVVHAFSDDEEIAVWEEMLWEEQQGLLEDYLREWAQGIHYCANRQHLVYHRDHRRWIPRRTVPWRIRSIYNVCSKAVRLRVSRLAENKPSISVQPRDTSPKSMDRAEYRQALWWELWDALNLHAKIRQARRWAAKAASGFLEFGWDPEAGSRFPRTESEVRYEMVPDPQTGQMQEIAVGLEEYYLDSQGKRLGTVFETVEGEDGTLGRQQNYPPPGTDYLYEGLPYCDVRSPFNVRWDRYTDDIWESWYVQDADIIPLTRLLALLPDLSLDILKKCKAAGAEDRIWQWTGLSPRVWDNEVDDHRRRVSEGSRGEQGRTETEYVIRRTFIFPRSQYLRDLWGENGCLLVTVGGQLVMKRDLPKWAAKHCPFVQLQDEPEEGNHYGKPPLRDLLPLQDDINRSRSQVAESVAIASRVLILADQNAQLNARTMGAMPGVLVSRRAGAQVETLRFDSKHEAAAQFYDSSLSAAQDLGDMNEASTGKLPSAGLPAKAIFALQYADEKSIIEASQQQDEALRRMAIILDCITRYEYTESRKVAVTGEDRSFLTEFEISPEDLQYEVDYYIVPGSMLTRQKETVRNELLSYAEMGLIPPARLKRLLPSAVPDAVRGSMDAQEAKVRRRIYRITQGNTENLAPDPWEDPGIGLEVLEEWMCSARFEGLQDEAKQALTMLWQAYTTMAQQEAQGGAPPPPGQPQEQPQPVAPPQQPIAPPAPVPDPVAGAEMMDQQAQVMEPPPGYESPGQPTPF